MKKDDLILVIDVQNVYLKGQPWACLNTEGAVKNIVRIAEKASAGQLAITEFLPPKNKGAWTDYNKKYQAINESEYLNQLVPEVQNLTEKFPLYSKSTYSSLSIPELRHKAEKSGRLVLTGVVSECCVLATAFDAMDLGCKIVWLTDAVSGFDTEKETAAELMLKGLFPVHGCFMTTDEYLGE